MVCMSYAGKFRMGILHVISLLVLLKLVITSTPKGYISMKWNIWRYMCVLKCGLGLLML